MTTPIDGIPVKRVAAGNVGATVFPAPADNRSEARTHLPASLRPVRVTSLASAVTELAEPRACRPTGIQATNWPSSHVSAVWHGRLSPAVGMLGFVVDRAEFRLPPGRSMPVAISLGAP
jgi:hypothetical protein